METYFIRLLLYSCFYSFFFKFFHEQIYFWYSGMVKILTNILEHIKNWQKSHCKIWQIFFVFCFYNIKTLQQMMSASNNKVQFRPDTISWRLTSQWQNLNISHLWLKITKENLFSSFSFSRSTRSLS